MKYITKEDMETDSISTLRECERNILNTRNSLFDLLNKVTEYTKEPMLNLIEALNKDLDFVKKKLDKREKEEGCSYCGAQYNENCRTIEEVGECVSFEDYKEKYN